MGKTSTANKNKFTIKMQKKLVVLFVLVLLAFAGLSARLIMINKEDGERYKKQVLSQQRYDSRTLPYKRGDIMDAKGTRMAMSEKVYNLVIDSKQMLEKEAYLEPTMQALISCFPLNEGEVRKYIADNPSSQYYVPLKQLTYEEISSFKELQNDTETNPNIKGVWFEEEYRRTYPYGSLACDVIGFTGKDNTGTYGLEEYYNSTLNGTNGRQYGYLNDDATLERSIKAAVDGNSIMSTIDVNIQSIVEKYILEFNEKHKGEAKGRENELGSKNTGVILMNPNNGEILAMASYPNFDLNNPKDLSAYYTPEEIEEMDDATYYDNLNKLWRNFCISDTYEPGSTAKAFTIAAGLEHGKLTGNESYECLGYMEIKGHPKPIRCNKRTGHGVLDVSGAFEQSCNVALMKMAFSIGKEDFMKEMKDLNFGLKTNIDLAGEARTETLIANVENMVPTDLAVYSFGQSYNTTMIQMASAYASLINGGKYYEPHMVSKVVSSNGATVENIEPRVLKQTVSASTSQKIIEYCDAVVAEGTGKSARPAGYTMGGKTGTAEKVPRDKKNYVVSFMGYAPAKNPEILIYVVIDEPNVDDQPHATYATEIVRNIMTEVLPYMNIFMTEELSEAEQKELEDRKQTMFTKPGTEDGEENAEGKDTNGEAEGGENADGKTETEGDAEEGSQEKLPEVKIDPETGYAIDPLTGEFLDPKTGEPIDGSSNLGGL